MGSHNYSERLHEAALIKPLLEDVKNSLKPGGNRSGTGRLTRVGWLIKLAANMDYSAHSIIWVLVIGLVIGAIAKLLMPGRDPGGCIVTILLGIAGAFVGTWIGRLVTGNETYVAHWIMSIVGAMLLLLLYRLLFRRR